PPAVCRPSRRRHSQARPQGYWYTSWAMELRAPRPEDAEPVLAVHAARDVADLGAPQITLEDILQDWRSSELDLSADARVAEHEGTICGYAVVRRSGSLGLVAPDHEGRGIGSRLLAWAEERERERATRPHRQLVVAGND